ncbi:UNVERIFIED_CONTAM: type IV secretory pathway TrbD component [Brevibacillus sp. OAP136]
MAYLFGLLFWMGTVAYCIYEWHSVNPNSFMPGIGYLIVLMKGILGTLASLVYFVLVFWYQEKFKYMFITLGILGLLCFFLAYPLLF